MIRKGVALTAMGAVVGGGVFKIVTASVVDEPTPRQRDYEDSFKIVVQKVTTHEEFLKAFFLKSITFAPERAILRRFSGVVAAPEAFCAGESSTMGWFKLVFRDDSTTVLASSARGKIFYTKLSSRRISPTETELGLSTYAVSDEPLSDWVVWLHKQYSKLLLSGASAALAK